MYVKIVASQRWDVFETQCVSYKVCMRAIKCFLSKLTYYCNIRLLSFSIYNIYVYYSLL